MVEAVVHFVLYDFGECGLVETSTAHCFHKYGRMSWSSGSTEPPRRYHPIPPSRNSHERQRLTLTSQTAHIIASAFSFPCLSL